MSFHLLRKRSGSTPSVIDPANAQLPTLAPAYQPQSNVVPGAFTRIMNGLFGVSAPQDNSSAQVRIGGPRNFYNFHEGDLFTPGTQNYALEYPFELPVVTLWGNAFLRKPNTFSPIQHPQVYSNPTVRINGIGGLVAGQIAFQPLDTGGS